MILWRNIEIFHFYHFDLTPDFPRFYYMLGENLGSLLYGDVSMILSARDELHCLWRHIPFYWFCYVVCKQQKCYIIIMTALNMLCAPANIKDADQPRYQCCMSHVMRKAAFAYAKTKVQVSCTVTFVFTTKIVHVLSLNFLNP